MRALSLTLSIVLAVLLGTAWAWSSERAVGAAAKRITAAESVPIPHRVHARSGPLTRARSKLVELDTAPFPYQGEVPRTQKPFLDVIENIARCYCTCPRASTFAAPAS
jgi:hypothetical protein